MMVRKLVFLGFILTFAAPGSTAIGGTNDDAKIAGHLTSHLTKGSPCTSPPAPACNEGESNLTVQGSVGVGYDLYILVLDGDPSAGVGGAAFGIAYDDSTQSGLDIYSWTLCASSEYSGGLDGASWPQSGSGNAIVWNSCQDTSAPGDTDNGVTAALGAFYVYAYGQDVFEITKREYAETPDFIVASCEPIDYSPPYPQNRGTISFGSSSGVDPCN